MGESPVIYALVKKRAELSGELAELDRQMRAVRVKISHVDSCLSMFGYRHHPSGIKPVKPRETLFKPGQLKRLVLDIRRETDRPMLNKEIASELIQRMGWSETDALLKIMAAKVKDVVKRLPADRR